RLREAFEALVPADDRRRVAALADEALAASGAEPAEMPRLRRELDHLVVSYDDSPFVGSAYARELTAARGRAEDLETAKPDPPERVDQWVASVSDGALRGLDLQVLTDLLAIDQDPGQFAAIAQQAATRIEELVRVGFIEPALTLEQALDAAREAGGGRGEAAEAALARLRTGSMVRDLMPLVRRAAPEDIDRITALLARLGPAIAPALATALAQEADRDARERLRSVLAGFGDAGEQAVRALLSSDSPEMRRNAALLLRDFGGAASVDVLERLLADSDLRVRREALRALAVVEDPQAHERILRIIESVPADTQRALLDELGLLRDVRVSPLLALLALRWREARMAEPAMRAIGLIGMLGPAATREAIDALAGLIDASQWWKPRRARAVRAHAADALAAAGTPEARGALEAAAARGGKGASAARRALARRQT
ncbi:MAG TPA: HEAT repeat domain-containing protein, partial [Vicinamibacterales bacterium]